MGLFSFLKGSGKKLGPSAAHAAEAPKAEVLKHELKQLGLDDKGIDIAVEGDKVVLSGKAVDAETREKIILAVGNVEGVASVEDADADDTAEAPVFHIVEKGETLSAIARKTLGDAKHYVKIFEANRPMLSDPDHIYPGQVLRIPKIES